MEQGAYEMYAPLFYFCGNADAAVPAICDATFAEIVAPFKLTVAPVAKIAPPCVTAELLLIVLLVRVSIEPLLTEMAPPDDALCPDVSVRSFTESVLLLSMEKTGDRPAALMVCPLPTRSIATPLMRNCPWLSVIVALARPDAN